MVRYYTIQSGINKNRKDRDFVSKRGRKREWRKKLHAAKSLKDFLQIEIQEPPPSPPPNTAALSSTSSSTSKTSTNTSTNTATNTATNTTSPLRKVQSFHISSTSSSPSKLSKDLPPKLSQHHRSYSNTELNNEHFNHHMTDHNKIINELGMTGTMLLQTTYRLKESRLDAISTHNALVSLKSCSRDNSIDENKDSDDEYGDGCDEAFGFPTSAYEYQRQPQIQQQQQQENSAASELKFLLQGVVKRNHLSINDILIKDSLNVMDSGRHHLSEQSRNVILNYHEEVEKCLEWMAKFGLDCSGEMPSVDDKLNQSNYNNNNSNNNNNNNASDANLYKELSDRLNLIRKMKHNMGRTALMLSGGGAQAMYHLGTIKALCESKLYDDIEVISGTSGGSISAAMCATKTSAELLKDVCVPHVSTDFGLTGEMKKKDIRWFPRVTQMGEYWLKHKLLVDPKDFKRCCDFYFGDITFEEAFEWTGKHVCITVSASRAEDSGTSSSGAQRLLLNHISTPHVTISSAVQASCALPGVMAPAKLVTKNNGSRKEFFEVDGVEWIDGSVQADLPFKRISTLFNVSNYIVCQTNFHVLPFLHKAHHPNTKSFYWRAFQTCEWDIRNRALNLSRLGLFPKIFGQDISKVFKQKYHGDLTLVPRFTTMQIFGLKSLVNPSYEEMEVYLQNGQASAWPYIRYVYISMFALLILFKG
jgi:predicted acylesterase/phospholipase RssA